jgi:hypothetical protein
MIYCSNCGRSIPADSKFCAFCGAAVPAIITEKLQTKTVKSRPYEFADHSKDFIRSAGFWGSLLVLAGFFLPWVRNTANDSAFNIIMHGHMLGRLTLLIFPLCALFILLDSFTNFLPSGAAVFFKVLPLLLLIAIIFLIVTGKQTTPGINSINTTKLENIAKATAVGLWLTTVGSLIMAAHKKYKRI